MLREKPGSVTLGNQQEGFRIMWQATTVRKVLKRRMAVEHAIGRLKNLGPGRAHHFGLMKTRAHWLGNQAAPSRRRRDQAGSEGGFRPDL
jgi:hypothetical protein